MPGVVSLPHGFGHQAADDTLTLAGALAGRERQRAHRRAPRRADHRHVDPQRRARHDRERRVNHKTFAVLLIACSSAPIVPPPNPHPLVPAEIALRHALGVPDEATRVVILGQNSHLDIDWQMTFDDYYSSYVENIFLQARALMDSDPRAFYAIAEMAYLKHHLDVHPEETAALQADVARGALRIIGGGMTSPDTLLPETEMLAHDYLFGIQFAEDTLGAHPTSAWLPDSFGHSGTAPDVLGAAGYTSVAFSRIDGAPSLFEKLFHPDTPMKPGSTAEYLQHVGSADFIWQGAGGASILAHFLSGTGLYCQGDNIDYQESLAKPGGHTGAFDDDPAFTDARIDGYAAELKPFAKTPYLFVPVGCDFQLPKTELVKYADGYDQRRYPLTGIWVVAAPFDDYEALVAFWKDVLPTVTNELSPYYQGYYDSRSDIKRGTRDAARPFLESEVYATALGDAGAAITASARPALELLTRTDHHDFLPGTSSNDVVASEQMPLLASSQSAGQAELDHVAAAIAARIPITQGATSRALALNASSSTRDAVATITLPLTPAVHAVANGTDVPMELASQDSTTATFRTLVTALPSFAWRAIDFVPGAPASVASQVTLTQNANQIILQNTRVRAELDAQAGIYALTSIAVDGVEMLSGASMLVHDYHDTGGLWRTGNEMTGCEFTELPAPTDVDAVSVIENGALGVRVAFTSASSTREIALYANQSALDVAITTGAAEITTRTVSFAFASGAAPLRTSSPAGFIERPLSRVYTPTFWPAVSWTEVGGDAILLRQSTGVMMTTPGALELMVARWAPAEQCDVEGGSGDDSGIHRIEWRLGRVASDAQAEIEAQSFNRPVVLEPVPLDQSTTLDLLPETSLLGVSGDGIVSTLKPADRGGGVIIRVLPMNGPVHVTFPASLVGTEMTTVDLAERDQNVLGPTQAAMDFTRASNGSIASVRCLLPH